MKYHVLLLEDVVNYGRKGDLVHVAPGFARNFLLPQEKALLASRATISMRERLQKERKEQSLVDRKNSEALAVKLKDQVFETVVKVDPDGHMYGSVTVVDIVDILGAKGFEITKRSVALHHPIRQIGTHHVALKLPEGVEVAVGLEVKPDREIKKKAKSKSEKTEEEASSQEALVDEAKKEEGNSQE